MFKHQVTLRLVFGRETKIRKNPCWDNGIQSFYGARTSTLIRILKQRPSRVPQDRSIQRSKVIAFVVTLRAFDWYTMCDIHIFPADADGQTSDRPLTWYFKHPVLYRIPKNEADSIHPAPMILVFQTTPFHLNNGPPLFNEILSIHFTCWILLNSLKSTSLNYGATIIVLKKKLTGKKATLLVTAVGTGGGDCTPSGLPCFFLQALASSENPCVTNCCWIT